MCSTNPGMLVVITKPIPMQIVALLFQRDVPVVFAGRSVQRLRNRHKMRMIREVTGFTNSDTYIFGHFQIPSFFHVFCLSSYPSLGMACLPSSLESSLCSFSFGCKDQYECHTQRAGAFVTTLCLLLPAPGVASRGVALHRQCCHCGGLDRAGGRFVLWCICLGRQGLPGAIVVGVAWCPIAAFLLQPQRASVITF